MIWQGGYFTHLWIENCVRFDIIRNRKIVGGIL